MNVHNIMEDIVSKHVNELYEQVKAEKSNWLTCDCQNCRLDTISYVLNRIPPKYVVSGRGVTHSSEVLNDHQLLADINELTLEGMRIVSTTKRPFHSQDRSDCMMKPNMSPAFNFYTFSGKILDGFNFEPVIGAKLTLKINGELAEMVDKTWINPYVTCKSTKGAYTFWVKSIPAEKAGIQKTFTFNLEISAEGYEDFTYTFAVPLVSEDSFRYELDSTYSLKIKDIMIFKNFIENPME